MRAPRIILLLPLVLAPALHAAEIVLTDPDFGKINASALDQPRLYALLSDPANGNAFFTWNNPNGELNEPALLTAFVDTGASGFAISHLHVIDDFGVANLGLQTADYTGSFTEIGIGGTELGDVTRPLGVWVSNTPIGSADALATTDFTAYGDFGLWVRREVGEGEYHETLGPDPINLVGMPVIRQRRLLLDPTPLAGLLPMTTSLLASGAPEPATQLTIPLVLRDFIGTTPPVGEVLPSHYANPLVPGLTLTEGGASATGEWLLDTGAGSSFASFAMAKAAGLIPSHYATLAAFMADYTGPTASIGGIGAAQVVPILNADRISVETREGATLVWKNVDLHVLDVAGLDGIFGMNLLVPAVTIDTSLLAGLGLEDSESTGLLDALGPLLALIFDISPSAINTIVIDTTDATDPVMRLGTRVANGTVFAWLGEKFSAAERSLSEIGSLSADADTDGLSNLLEYSLGLDPRVADNASSAAPAASTPLVGEASHLALTYTRPDGGRADVDYVVEISNDLATWRRGTDEVVPHATETVGDRETLTLRTAAPLAPGGRVFLRLRVSIAD